MNAHRSLATAHRVLQQLHHDHRTLALVLLVPSILMIIMRWVFNDASATFSALAPMILGIFPFTVMFLVTSVATLRERTSGTLERLMTLPIGKLDLLIGYALAFSLLTVLQATIATAVVMGLLDVSIQGSPGSILLVALLAGLLGMSLGLFLSAFARNEFQAVQFLPAFVLPQLLVCGLFVARSQMAEPLQWFANFMPLSYLVDAMKQVSLYPDWTDDLVRDVIVVSAFIIGALLLGAATLRRSHK